MELNKEKDVNKWIGYGIMSNNSKNLGVFNLAVDKSKNEIIGFCNVVENKNRIFELGIKEVHAFVNVKNKISKNLLCKIGFVKQDKKENNFHLIKGN